ncbi:MAG: Gfo/Idh/MocA family oxidoreductase [Verrucomicrobia bacterium]|nr:Gfo/Idh/MocA family oxidoreductase [Verrucomicrobiota bacterium]
MENLKTPNFSRRQFLKIASAAMAMPLVVPAHVLGRGGGVAPSEKIIMGCIGIRGRGTGDLKKMMGEQDVQFVAICDIRKDRREAVKEMIDSRYNSKDCKMYRDLREFVTERADIDGVLIATGDRWHALASIYAMRAGKDVYTEKPSSLTIAEGRAVVETAKQYGRIYQTGTQRLSEANHVFCIEMARTGRLGKVHTAYAHISGGTAAGLKQDWLPEEPLPSKDEVDWDAWLGPCPWRPYNSRYIQGGWRGHYDFHTSCIGEWGAHTFAQAQAGLDMSDTSPVLYKYIDNDSGDGMVTQFANGTKMIFSQGKKHWHGSCGERFDGEEGWVAAADGYQKPDASSPSLLSEYKKVIAEYVARTGRSLDHWRNFFDCMRSRQQTVANPSVMHHSMMTVHAANICMWLKRDMKLDPEKEEFINDPEANRYRSRAMRAPWTI